MKFVKPITIGLCLLILVTGAAVWFQQPIEISDLNVVRCKTKDGAHIFVEVSLSRISGIEVTEDQRKRFNEIFRSLVSQLTEDQMLVPGTSQKLSEEALKKFLDESQL